MRWLIKLLVTIGLLALILGQLDVEELWRSLASAHPAPFAAGMAAVLLMRICAAARMCVVLQRHLVSVSLARLFAINLRAAFISFFLPGHIAGGVVRWHLLMRQGASGAGALTAIGFDRLNEFSVVILTGLACSLMSRQAGMPSIVPLLLVATFAGLLVLQVAVMSERFVTIAWIAGTHLGVFRWRLASRAFEKLAVSAGAFRALPLRCRVQIWGWSLVSNAVGLLSYYWLAQSVDLPLGVFDLGWIRSAVTTLGMLPLTLSGLGVREGAMIALLAGYGVTPVAAVVFSLLLFVRAVVVALAGGLLVAVDVLAGRIWQPAPKPRSAS